MNIYEMTNNELYMLIAPGHPSGHYVEAVDGCVKHDMPNSHYYVTKRTKECTEMWVVRHIHYFACFDGWDNHDEDVSEHPTERDALMAAVSYMARAYFQTIGEGV